MTELEEALLALRVAENHFAEATEPDYIDLALDEIDVAHARLRLGLRLGMRLGLRLGMLFGMLLGLRLGMPNVTGRTRN